MNEMSEITTIDIKAPLVSGADRGGSLSGMSPSRGVKGNMDQGGYQGDSDHRRYFLDLVNKYIIAIWLLGVIIALSINLVAFSMIDNMDEITFAYRNTQSTNVLDTTKYDTVFSFFRGYFEEKYDNL